MKKRVYYRPKYNNVLHGYGGQREYLDLYYRVFLNSLNPGKLYQFNKKDSKELIILTSLNENHINDHLTGAIYNDHIRWANVHGGTAVVLCLTKINLRSIGKDCFLEEIPIFFYDKKYCTMTVAPEICYELI